MKMFKMIFLCALVATMAGCASIAGDNNRAVRVTSNPAGASIYVDNQKFGTTPAVVNLPNYIYGGKTITVRKRGYQDQSMVVNTRFQPVALLDFLFWPALVVDGANGSIVKIDPASSHIHANLHQA